MVKAKVTYADAGVNIDAGNALVERIKPLAKATARKGLMGGIGGFGALFDLKATGYKDPILVSTTDGVGTKLKIAQQLGRHDTIGIDLVAMCVNDLIVQGAEPLFFLDYFATSKLDVNVAEQVIKGIADGCTLAGCALVGGETAEMPGMYEPGEYDLAGFAVGAVERDAILPKEVKAGDVMLGLASSGVHSNGYSFIRFMMEDRKLSYDDNNQIPGHTLAEAFLTPTKIYVRSCLAAIKTGSVKALAHITGGGLLENIPRILPENVVASLLLPTSPAHSLFSWIQNNGDVPLTEMYRTFNCGIGMVLVVEPNRADEVRQLLEKHGEKVYKIGHIIAGSGKPKVNIPQTPSWLRNQ